MTFRPLTPEEKAKFDTAWDASKVLETINSKTILTKVDEKRLRAANHSITPANDRRDIRAKILEAARRALKSGGALVEHGGTQTHNDIIQAIKAQNAHLYTHKSSGKIIPLSDDAIRKHLSGWLPIGKPGRPGKAKQTAF
ncbi:hypothetical protein [Halothiobacillus sp.]|uniref:hypothetical protein n=1 Tax=Halothiobacillus sp. TaxID=1891311 RepID=UPI00298379F3|nr:hypothetical protein [Halothiobacillus sp.]